MQKSRLNESIITTVFYTVLAAILLLVINITNIWHFCVTHILGTTTIPDTRNYASVVAPVFKYLDKLNSLSLMVFWGVVGTVAYVLVIWLQTALSSIFNEAKEASYVRPAVDQKSYWHNTIISNLTVLGLVIGWIVSLFLFVQVLLPRFSKLLNKSLDMGTFGQRVGHLASAIILTTICLFLIVKLSQLLKKSWRRFSAQ